VEAVDEMSSCSATWICQFEVYNRDLEITRETMRINFLKIYTFGKNVKCREKFSISYSKLNGDVGCKVYLSKRHRRKEPKKANNKQKANHPRQRWIFKGITIFS